MYPRPTDLDSFENVYRDEHIPMAVAKLVGKTKIIATKVLDSPQAPPEGGQATLAHAESISSGGGPILLLAEETLTFEEAGREAA